MVEVRTGFREATFRPDGFYLNGQRAEIFGLNRHQLFPYLGMAAPARLQRRDAELLRSELNCNMVRCSHYPQSPHFLDACDELGLMVWEEPPGWQYVGDAAFQEIVVQNVTTWWSATATGPSVIIWATRLNETANYPALYAQTRQLADSLDGSRQTSGRDGRPVDLGWAEDVFAYDDYHTPNGNATLSRRCPACRTWSPRRSARWTERRCTAGSTPTRRWPLQARCTPRCTTSRPVEPGYAGLLAGPGSTTRR